jgi:tRNA dimethylallyltransferase
VNDSGSASGDRLVALVGPTAVGKSEVALALAEQLNGEIVSVDSMQVYRGMDVGTAKPSAFDRSRVPHHLIDVADITADFNAAQFIVLARQTVEEIRHRGRVPVLCGGTGLYLKAFFQGLGQAPPGSATLRAELERVPLIKLLAELATRDPNTYERIDRQNPRRVIRALEVIRLTGRPYSIQRAEWSSKSGLMRDVLIFGLVRDPVDLRQRIEFRVDAMFSQGLVAETQALLGAGLASNRTALQALGYRQVTEYLEGIRSLQETIDLVKVRTRQFAKRQMTWFRRQLPVDWVHLGRTDTASRIAVQIAERTQA